MLLQRCETCPKRLVRPAVACYWCVLKDAETADPECPVCGGRSGEGYDECYSCGFQKPRRAFSRNMTIVYRSDDVHHAVVSYKYGAGRASGVLLARLLEGFCSVCDESVSHFDYIVPMPWCENPDGGASFDHMRQLLAAAAPHLPHLPIDTATPLIEKTAPTSSMVGNDRQSRLARYRDIHAALNVAADDNLVRNRRFLIVDDVFTTGTTLNAAAHCLRDRGAAEVCGLSLLRRT